MNLKENIITECKAMMKHALSTGKQMPNQLISLYEHMIQNEEENTEPNWMRLHNLLSKLVAPAKPCTLALMNKDMNRKKLIHWLGPVPIFQNFILVMLVSLVLMLGLGLTDFINIQNIQKGIFTLSGFPLVVVLLFLLAAASLGASFAALYKANEYVIKGTFESKYNMTYWARYFLGLVSGILLAELFPPNLFVDSLDLNSAYTSVKPLLALLGGFSATAFYRILNAFVETIDRIFKNNSKRMYEDREKLNAQINEYKQKNKEYEFLNKLNDFSKNATTEEIKEFIDKYSNTFKS